MNEDDLIKLAAKAAGIRGEWNEACSKFEKLGDEGWHAGFFDPLADDGDALRLAVKLGIAVRRISNKAMVSSSVGQFDEYCDNNPCAAIRRAIVRAAAAIGENL